MKAKHGIVPVGLAALWVPMLAMAQPPMQAARRTVDAGPLWNDREAQGTCPAVCGGVEAWTRGWWTTVPNRMAVCECIVPNPRALPQPRYAPAPPPGPQPMNDATFGAFLQHVKDATFKDAQLAAVSDAVRAGNLWTTRQLIAVMQLLTFGDAQVNAATQMWANIVDPQNLPDVLASLTFESDRTKLRQALGR